MPGPPYQAAHNAGMAGIKGEKAVNTSFIRTRLLGTVLGTGALAVLPVLAQAQQAASEPAAKSADTDKKPGAVGLEEVVITARAKPQTKLRSSISVTSLSPDTIAQSSPSSAADILRDVPGIRAEASGGEGNANIAVRGLPVATGGAKYAQFQEDGLPVLEFGDIDFATADTFLRADANIARLEVVRGGSASTFTSNAPGAVFNFISKTGEVEGGSISTQQGLGYDEHRFDFDYGRPLGDGWRFHVGGFYREGDGPRTSDQVSENGGQFKGNVTKDFDRGFAQLNFKYLNDDSPAYLPVPILITGSPKNPHLSSVPGFSVQDGTFLSPYFASDQYYDHNGNLKSIRLTDGYHAVDAAVGGEVSYDLYDGLKIDEKFRYAAISGDFVGIYPATVESAQSLATSIGGTGATLRYASGPLAGTSITDPAMLSGNGLASQNTLFNTTLNSLNNFTNDVKFTKSVETETLGKFDFAAGYYHSDQDIVEDWHWNSYVQTVQGEKSSLLNVFNASGKQLTLDGNTGYNAGFGFCCARYYDLHYTTNAPYLSGTWQLGPWNFDASLRYDFAGASGSYTGGGAQQLLPTGNASVPYLPGVLVDPATALPVNYTKGYLSYSFGLNYLIDPSLAVFVRGSQGGRANAERILFGAGVLPDGNVPQDVAIDLVQQVEGGVKWRTPYFTLFGTGFYAHTQETNYDVTNRIQPLVSATYQAEGLEIQANAHYGNFQIALGGTYTHSRIIADQITPADVGNVPQRQADFVYQITPGYYAENWNAGVNIIGTTSSYADDANSLVMPGYTEVNLFGNYDIRPNIRISFTINNAFNTIGLTEIDNLPNAQGVATARSINGRTAKVGLRFTF
jgi:outer membrane receptor protein involved in Fe transport